MGGPLSASAWTVFGVERELVVYGRKVTIWVEGVYTEANPYEWHLAADKYDDEGRSMTLEQGKRDAMAAVRKFRRWALRQRQVRSRKSA